MSCAVAETLSHVTGAIAFLIALIHGHTCRGRQVAAVTQRRALHYAHAPRPD
jgi:hypothetical protein